MTDTGSGRRDDQDRSPDGSDDQGTGDDYPPSASWESSRGSSWENTTPYESPWAKPGSTGSGTSASSYQSASGYESSYPYSPDREQPTASSTSSATDRPTDDGPWPAYPEPSEPDYGPPAPGFGQQPGYGQPSSYGSASDPYGHQPPAGNPYGQSQYEQSQPGQDQYGQNQTPYGQQPQYDQYGQQPAYAVNPYQQPAYGGYALPNHPQATTALILGIVGLALCPFVGIAAFVMGGRVRREIDAAPHQWGGRGLATGGWVLGIISLVYAAILLVYLIVIIVVAAAS